MDKKNRNILHILLVTFLLITILITTFFSGFYIGKDVQTRLNMDKVQVEIEKLIILDEEVIEENNKLIQENQQLTKEIEQLNKSLKLSQYSDEEIEILCRVAEAEAGKNKPNAQANVVFVILNRVNSERFPNDITSVVHSPGQFAVINNGAYKAVKITPELKETINHALLDYEPEKSADGALFFARGRTPGREFLFKDDVGHIFEK